MDKIKPTNSNELNYSVPLAKKNAHTNPELADLIVVLTVAEEYFTTYIAKDFTPILTKITVI